MDATRPRSPIDARVRDVGAALVTLPTAAAWRRCAYVYALFLALALPLGLTSGVLSASLAPLTAASAARLALAVAVHPAFTEELVFRALLLPRRAAPGRRFALAVAAALTLYVVAHPVNAALFRPDTLGLFSDPAYLAMTTLLGLACTAAYVTSGSIWPAVLMHWLTVVLWILTLGGYALLGRH